jgi:hypothetical protein
MGWMVMPCPSTHSQIYDVSTLKVFIAFAGRSALATRADTTALPWSAEDNE